MAARLGFLGPPGTFGEQAALRLDSGATLVPYASHAAIVEAVASGKAETGIVAIENSLEGAVNETVDALLQHEGVYIRGEIVLPVEHCLVAAPGTDLADVATVTSHPQALAQCRAYLEANLPSARLEAALSTAAAVARAAKEPGVAAIGTRRAAELNGGAVLAAGIQDVARNKTRFLVLGPGDAPPTGDDKTSIALTVAHDRPGTLLGVLSELAPRGINLTRIESRPSREELGIYIFLLDFQGHASEPSVAEAIAAVRAKATYFRLLGSYPRFGDSQS
jgi:prephenate dehydratase